MLSFRVCATRGMRQAASPAEAHSQLSQPASTVGGSFLVAAPGQTTQQHTSSDITRLLAAVCAGQQRLPAAELH